MRRFQRPDFHKVKEMHELFNHKTKKGVNFLDDSSLDLLKNLGFEKCCVEFLVQAFSRPTSVQTRLHRMFI